MRRRHAAVIFVLLLAPGLAVAAGQAVVLVPRPATAGPQGVRLWQGSAPGAVGAADRDTPTLTFYPPRVRGTGTSVVVAPGGGYRALALNHEGRQIANWFNAQGVAAFVLKYRLGPTYRHLVELGDVQRALRLVRTRAAEFGIRPDRIGLMGFSAGGHLASTAATHFDSGSASALDEVDRASSRPDFLVLAYPVITSSGPYVHQGSMRNLLGESPSQALVDLLSSDRQVTSDTPPTFLFHTNADTAVPAENSVLFYLALRQAGVPAELHIFEPGPHGVGLGMTDPVLAAWPPLLSQWMRHRGLLTAAPHQNRTTMPAVSGTDQRRLTSLIRSRPVPASPSAGFRLSCHRRSADAWTPKLSVTRY